SALTAKSGQAFALGGLLTTLDTLSNEEYVFGFSQGLVGDVQLILNTGTATPVVTVAATDANAGEPANNGQYTLTRTGDTTSALTVNIAMSGTATNGTDYTAIPATVTFESGFSTATVDLNVIDDTLPEGTETATLTVLAGSGYTPGSLGTSTASGSPAGQGNGNLAASATVSIADDEPPLNTITLDAADTGWYDVTGYHDPGNTNYVVGDYYGSSWRNWFTFNLPTLTAPIISAQLKVNTYEFSSEDAIETYELRDVTTAVPTLTAGGSGLTAIYTDLGDGAIYGSRNYENGDDYQFRTIDLNAAAISALTAKSGQAFALGGLLTTLDTLSNEEYVFGFSNGNVGDVQLILNTGTATKSISIAKTTDGKEAGPVSSVFTLTRTGDLSSALTVNYTLAGTATLGSDYNDPSLGQATFAAGADKATITLPTIDDSVVDPSETIITKITAPAGYTISGPDTATATIIDDDLGTLTLVKTTDGKEAGPVSSVFTLTRTGDLSSALTVNYTLGGTATPGVDYTGTTPNSVTFAAGSSKATITLPTKDDLLSDPSETIITTITAPVGYTISGPDTATATILDNDGNLDNNNLVGTSFADALAGEGGNDTLNGGAGNDTLDGGVGVDLMDGGDNNDTYYVDNVGDIVKESSDDALGGTADTVFASVTYSLAPGTLGQQGYGIENLTLTGDANINATGNGKNNVLTGNSGSNVLNGGLGNDTLNGDLGLDTLTGGAGNDFFRFDNVENSDLITDFSVADDTIILANSLDGTLTGSLGMGIKGLVFNSANANGSVLNAAWFFKGAGFTGGASGNPAGIYVNTSNGDIWYNDSTVVGSYLMANVGAGAAAAMTNLDFVYRV
ncbi:MAG: beta strand repeat-containing protein, partial [Microcystis panniformis]